MSDFSGRSSCLKVKIMGSYFPIKFLQVAGTAKKPFNNKKTLLVVDWSQLSFLSPISPSNPSKFYPKQYIYIA
jgi:hypothetical protein